MHLVFLVEDGRLCGLQIEAIKLIEVVAVEVLLAHRLVRERKRLTKDDLIEVDDSTLAINQNGLSEARRLADSHATLIHKQDLMGLHAG